MSAVAPKARVEPCGVGIIGMGECLPDTIRTNDWWPESWREAHASRLAADVVGSVDRAAHDRSSEIDAEVVRHAGPYFRDLYRGTRERRVLDAGQRPSDLEVGACRAALKDARCPADTVDALLVSGIVSDFAIMSNAGDVAHRLGLRRDVSVLEVNVGCVGFLHQLRLAVSLVRSGEARRVLVVCSSGVSQVTDYALPSSVVPGDGAVAAVIARVEPEYGYIGSVARTLGDMHRGILLVRKSDPAASWFAAADEPLTVQRVDGRAAHVAGARAASLFRETVTDLLERTGYRAEEIGLLAVSQAGAWFGAALADTIGLSHDRITPPSDHFERFGHMMQASLPMNLHVGRRTGRLRDGDLVLAYSPGVGFTTMASIFRWRAPA